MLRIGLLAASLVLVAAACSKPASAPPPPSAMRDRSAMPPVAHAAAPSPMPQELAGRLLPLQEKMKAQPRSFAAAAQVGDLLFENARYVEAVDTYRQALERAQDTLALLDELSAQNPSAAVPEAKAAGCPSSSAESVEPNDAKARAARDHGEPGPALACARQAAAPVLSAAARRAQGLFLIGNVDQAITEYEKVLKRDPSSADALFFVGALKINRRGVGTTGMQEAAASWKRFLEVAPKDHPRREEVEKALPQLQAVLARAAAQPSANAMPPAGQRDLPPGHPSMGDGPNAMPSMPPSMPAGAMGAAMPGAHASASLEQSMDAGEEALARGDGAAAVRAYMGAMSSGSDDPRLQAGLAASQFLKGSAIAQRVFEVAAARDPKAIDELAGRLQAKGNPGLARTLRQQLAVAAPDYASKAARAP